MFFLRFVYRLSIGRKPEDNRTAGSAHLKSAVAKLLENSRKGAEEVFQPLFKSRLLIFLIPGSMI